MDMMWTPEQVARIMDAEKERAYYRKYQKEAPRLEAIRVVHDAMRLADIRYLNRVAEIKRDMEIGIIGPDGQPHKTSREAWLAAEVKYSLLKELNDESPIREDYENETNQ
jgi:hypothetical protein